MKKTFISSSIIVLTLLAAVPCVYAINWLPYMKYVYHLENYNGSAVLLNESRNLSFRGNLTTASSNYGWGNPKFGGSSAFLNNANGSVMRANRWNDTYNDTGQKFTLTMWVNATYATCDIGGPGTGCFVFASSVGDDWFTLYRPANELRIKGAFYNVPDWPSLNVWHHLAIVYDQNDSYGPTVCVHYDGVGQGCFSTGYWHNNASFYTWGYYAPATGNLQGHIDELAVWNESLNKTMIEELYNGSRSTGSDCDYTIDLCAGGGPDTTPPTITVVNPLNRTYSSTTANYSFFNVTLNENGSTCKAELDGTNHTMTNTTTPTAWNYTNTTMNDGQHTVKYWCNDTSGNMGSTNTTNFTIDITPPNTAYIDPTPSDNTSGVYTSIVVNISSTDATSTINRSILWWNGTNYTMTVNYNYSNYTASTPTGGVYYYRTYTNDTAGNWNHTETRRINIAGLVNVYVYDETNNTLITSENITVYVLYPDSYAVYQSNTTNNGCVNFTLVGAPWVFKAYNNKSYIYPRHVLQTIIYTPSQNVSIYLPEGNQSVVFDTFKLYDYTDYYTGATFTIKKYFNTTLQIIHSTFFDVIDRAFAYLITGEKYQLTITPTTGAERTFGWFVPSSVSEDVAINTINISFNLEFDYINAGVNYTTYVNNTAIIFYYNDTTQTTNLLEWWVYNETNTSDVLLYTSTTASEALLSYTPPNPNLTYTTRHRTNTTAFGVTEAYSMARPAIPSTHRLLDLGLDSTKTWWYTGISMLILIVLAGIFAGIDTRIGCIIIASASLFFWWVGWLDLGERTHAIFILSTALFMAGLNMLLGERRR